MWHDKYILIAVPVRVGFGFTEKSLYLRDKIKLIQYNAFVHYVTIRFPRKGDDDRW